MEEYETLGAFLEHVSLVMDNDAAADEAKVTIMTIHAAKGLEAPVVFLVDPGSAPFVHAHGAKLIAWDAMPGLAPHAPPGFLWCPEKSLVNGDVEALRSAERERAEDEYRRLLYVGMTRAADRLVICGHAGLNGPHEDSWLTRVSGSLGPRCTRIYDDEENLTTLRWGSPPDGEAMAVPAAPVAPTPVRFIDLSPLPPEIVPPRPLVPSDPAGAVRIEKADDLSGASPVLAAAVEPSLAIRRGLLVHRLLQVLPDLPEDERAGAGARYLTGAASDFGAAEHDALLASAMAVLNDTRFATLFSPGSRAEIGVRGTVRIGETAYPVSGTIDRLAVGPDAILIADYKTNRPPPADLAAVPPSYILQLALYRALLAPLYPGRPVRAALIFTEAPAMLELPEAAMDAALAQLASRRAPTA